MVAVVDQLAENHHAVAEAEGHLALDRLDHQDLLDREAPEGHVPTPARHGSQT